VTPVREQLSLAGMPPAIPAAPVGKTPTVAFRVDGKMYAVLARLELQLGLTPSEVLRQALTLGLPLLDPDDTSVVRPSFARPTKRTRKAEPKKAKRVKRKPKVTR
jgi:hypothetical protein